MSDDDSLSFASGVCAHACGSSEVLIPLMWLAFTITMLPNLGILAWGNHRFGFFGVNLVIAMAMLVDSIGRDLLDRFFNGIQYIAEHFSIMGIISGGHRREDFARCLIHT